MNFIMTYHFYLKERNLEKLKSLLLIYAMKLILKNVHRVIKFNQQVWLGTYIVMNTELRQKVILRMIFSKLMNNAVFGKTMENVRKQRH